MRRASGNHTTDTKIAVFISYSRADLQFADQLDVTLDLAGFDCTLDRQGIHGAENWQEKLGAMIRDADTVVFVLSPSSATSKICAWEVDEAVRLGKRIVPVVPEALGDAQVPTPLATLNYILFYPEPKSPGSGFRTGIADLIKTLNTDFVWLREHTRYQQRAFEWEHGGQQTHRLLSGDDIAMAKVWVARRPKEAPAPTEVQLAFINASETWAAEQSSERQRQLEERERIVREAEADRKAREDAQHEALQRARQVVRRTMVGLAAALLLAIVAGAAGYTAFKQRQAALNMATREKDAREEATRMAAEATKQATAAEQRKQETEALREQTQKTESGLLANAAAKVLDDPNDGDAVKAALIAMEALPDASVGQQRPYVAAAERELERALRAIREIATLGHDDDVNSVEFSPDGRRVATTSNDRTARIWDAETGEELSVLGHDHLVRAAVFSPDSRRLLTTEGNVLDEKTGSTVHVWDTATGKEVFRLAHSATVVAARFDLQGSKIVTTSDDKSAHLWDAKTGTELFRLDHGHTVSQANFGPTGTTLLTIQGDNSVQIWNLETRAKIASMTHSLGVLSATLSPDGSLVATGCGDKSARVWDAASGRLLHELKHEQMVSYVAFGADANRLLTLDHDARIWNTQSGEQILQLKRDFTTQASTFDEAAKRVATASGTAVRIWDSSTGTLIDSLSHDAAVALVRFNKSGTRLAVGAGKAVRIWDVDPTRVTAAKVLHDASVLSAVISPDSQQFLTASADKSAKLWDMASGKHLQSLMHDGEVTDANFSPDASRIVTAAKDNAARVWDAKTGAELAHLDHEGPVLAVAFSLDGSRVATASEDLTARIWTFATGRQIELAHDGGVRAVAFSDDGRQLVTASDDNIARVWDVKPVPNSCHSWIHLATGLCDGTGKRKSRLARVSFLATVDAGSIITCRRAEAAGGQHNP